MIRDKDKTRPTRGSTGDTPTSEIPPTNSQQGLASRSTINSLIAGAPGPVSDAAGARRWLDSKGWVLAGEEYDRSKMVSVLLTASLTPRIPSEAATAIRAVAFLLESNITDKTADHLANEVSNKVKAELTHIISGLSATQSFLEASATQQANSIIELKEITATTKSNSDNFSALTDKLTAINSATTSTPPPPQWPSLRPSPPSLPPNTYDPASPSSTTRLRQRLLLASRTVLVHVDPGDDLAPTDRTPPALQDLRISINKDLDEYDDLSPHLFTSNNGTSTKTIIRGLQALKRGAFLFDLDSAASADRFRHYAKEHPGFLPSHLGLSATVKPKNFNLIFKFVPCTSGFDPSNPDCLSTIESSNNLKPGSITSASWLKRSDRRSPNQTVASLKVVCDSPEAANHLLCERIYIEGQVITVRKDIREPIRCNKCQEYGHIRADCKSNEICAHCTSPSHTSSTCPPNQPPHCHSCGPDSHHPSYSRKCPAFISKCESLDSQYPENSMPYFPTGEPWTWATSPPKLSTSPPTPRPVINHDLPHPSLPQRPVPPPPPPSRYQANLDQFLIPPRSGSQSQIRRSQPHPPADT